MAALQGLASSVHGSNGRSTLPRLGAELVAAQLMAPLGEGEAAAPVA